MNVVVFVQGILEKSLYIFPSEKLVICEQGRGVVVKIST